jgi:conjugative transfer signal peptidase TraF
LNVIERTAFLGMVGFAIVGSSFEFATYKGLRFNVDHSMPLGAYWFVPGPVWRGATVQSCLPPSLAHYALRRRILSEGSCSTGVMPVVKMVAAIGGDVVVVSDSGLRINGNLWPMSAPRRFDANGRRVDFRLHSGRYVVPADHVFLLGESANSWDSRYWGSVARSTVAGRWVPLYLLS